MKLDLDRYHVRVMRAMANGGFRATCLEFPGIEATDVDAVGAYQQLAARINDEVARRIAAGLPIPAPQD